jgi:GntR family transcriptional regulator
MQLSIEPGGHLPVHVQLKEQLKFLILNGDLEPGARLPTTRQLAGFLRINRNTVLRAYQELAREGLIDCRQGRGCVVVEERSPDAAQPVPARLLGIIDGAIEQARELGVSADDFATTAYARAKQRWDVQGQRKILFVECDAQTAADFALVIQERLDVEVIPLVLQDLEHPTTETGQHLLEARAVATTFFHIEEVERLLSRTGKETVALTVKPHLEALVRVAGIPKGTSVALVCVDEHNAGLMGQSLEQAGVRGLDVALCGANEPQKLAETLAQVSVVVASDHVADQVRPLVRPGQQLIVLNYMELDDGGINLLKSVI